MSKNGKPKLIPAVGYLRKSTKEERTEKSIADQRGRITRLKPIEEGAKYQIVRWYDKDKGVPGWKRGASRPDYFRLVRELKETGAKAILVDDMDRFSRAQDMDVVHDVAELREKHGIRYIHAVNQGCVDIVTDPMATIKITMWAMAGHEFSTRLSRRIANARKDAALQGKRSGGEAPYGMENDGKGGLKHGDPDKVRIVRWIFDQFVNHLKSMNWIAAELNRKGIPTRKGGKWYVATIKELLQRREYRGDFSYNGKKSGQFHIINAKHEVIPVFCHDENKPKPWKVTDEGRIVLEGVYKPLVAPELFDAAQKRLESFSLKGSRKPRADGYPLSRVLICDHCGKPMYGCRPTGRNYRVYRCSTPAKSGMTTCGAYEVREELILPFVLRMLGEEIKDIQAMLTAPPDELCQPNKERDERREQVERERAELAAMIERAEDNILCIEDARTRQALDRKLTAMRDRLERLDAELATEPSTDNSYTREDLAALASWWDEFMARAVSVPVPGQWPLEAHFYQDPASEEGALLIDARVVNEALHALGAEVRLRWKTDKVMLSNGAVRNRYTLARGRFRLGQRQGQFSVKNGVRRYSARLEGPCNGTPGEDRCDTRKGKDSKPRRA